MDVTSTVWKLCSSCKKPIYLKSVYWTCNVSTCNRKRTGLVFCSVECWDAHVPMYNHRESWAIENRAPKELTADDLPEAEGTKSEKSAAPSASRRVVSDREKFISGLGSEETVEDEREYNMTEGNAEKEVLIVASKLKNYIRAKSGMNTSAAVIDVLSDKVRDLCDQAVEAAKRDGRKTVMDRDFA